MSTLSSIKSGRGQTAVGNIIPSGVGSAPTGYLPCDGTAVSRTTYAALFAVIGTTFGAGDGSTTFNLPNTAGLFLRGQGSQTVSAKVFNGGSVGNKQKDLTAVNGLGIGTVSTPSLSLSNTDLTHTHSYSDLTTSFSVIPNASLGSSATTERQGYSPTNQAEADTTGSALGSHAHTITPSITGVTTTLSSTGTETKPAHVTVAFYIKF